MTQITPKILASLIDHTQLMPFATKQDIKKLCKEAAELGTATVCVNEGRVEEARFFLDELNEENKADNSGNSNVKVCCTIGFPLGSATTEIKVESALDVIKKGAQEIDMVINVGYLKDKDYDRFEQDIEAVMEAIDNYNSEHDSKIVLKVIQENCYLTDEEIILATKIIAKLAGNFRNVKVFAKTSTGFGVPGKGPVDKEDVGATEKDISIMKTAIDNVTNCKYVVGIKAAGGIRDKETALNMMKAAGCFDEQGNLVENYKELFRIGASASREISK